MTLIDSVMPVVGPPWTAEAPVLDDYLLEDHVVAVLQWDDGAGEELDDWLDLVYFEPANWPSSPTCSVPATAPEKQLVKWVRSVLRLPAAQPVWLERRAVVERVGFGPFRKLAVLLVCTSG